MDITSKIHKHRKEKGWSIAKLARESKIPTVSLRVMLSREGNSYNIKSLKKISDVLGVSVSYLTKEENENNKPNITENQKRELMEILSKAIDSYFETN